MFCIQHIIKERNCVILLVDGSFLLDFYSNKQISSKCVSIYFLFLMLFNSYNRNLDVKLKNQCSANIYFSDQ